MVGMWRRWWRRSYKAKLRLCEMPAHCSLDSIKGHVAGTIIQELLLEHGFNVFPYGMERSIPGIAHLTPWTVGEVKRNNS